MDRIPLLRKRCRGDRLGNRQKRREEPKAP
jgi:hypothetical protein